MAPGAHFVILEFSTPRAAIVRAGYHAYFHDVEKPHHAIVFADGTVRNISYSIQKTTFSRLGNRSDGQPIPADFEW